MFLKKSISFVLLGIIGFPQISLAENITGIFTETTNSLELTEEEVLLSQSRDEIRRRVRDSSRKLRDRRREIRSRSKDRIRDRAYDRRDYRRERRREIRDDLRDSARRARNRRTARRVIGGITTLGIGAAIANQNRNYRNNSENIIIDQGDYLRERDYYDDLYKCQHLEQGGYYDADELEDCLRRY